MKKMGKGEFKRYKQLLKKVRLSIKQMRTIVLLDPYKYNLKGSILL